MERIVAFLLENTPSARAVLFGGPPLLLWSWLCLRLAAHLKVARGLKTGYTRKTFHLLTFLSAVALQYRCGLPVVFLYGAVVSIVLAYAVIRGDGHPLYEAIARPDDAPHRTYFIIIPYCATLLGGLASNLLFGPAAIIGYLVGGMGDAAGEPVGTRWGRHRYVVPSIGSAKRTRSYEGSAGVFIVSIIAVVTGVALSPHLHFTQVSVVVIPALAFACAVVEAVSPHGWDNTTMQVFPAMLAHLFL